MEKNEPVSDDAKGLSELLRTYGAANVALGVILAAIGFSMHGKTTVENCLSFLLCLGSLFPMLRGWVLMSIHNEKAFWSFQSVFSKYRVNSQSAKAVKQR